MEESVALEGRFRPAACLKREHCASAVANCLNTLVEDISRQNWKLGEKSIDKSALAMKLRDIVLQRTLAEFEEHTNRKNFAAEYTSEEIRKKNTCALGECSSRLVGKNRKVASPRGYRGSRLSF